MDTRGRKVRSQWSGSGWRRAIETTGVVPVWKDRRIMYETEVQSESDVAGSRGVTLAVRQDTRIEPGGC